jgi:hypothetical protein
MTVQENYQRERTRAPRPGDVSFHAAAGAGIKETNGLLAFEGCQSRIRDDPNRVASKQK